MKVKRLRKIKVNCSEFTITWNKAHRGGSFDYSRETIEIGAGGKEEEIFMIVCHELMEIVTCEMCVRFKRPDCDDYIFVYDHRQHETIMCMFAGLITQFIQQEGIK